MHLIRLIDNENIFKRTQKKEKRSGKNHSLINNISFIEFIDPRKRRRFIHPAFITIAIDYVKLIRSKRESIRKRIKCKRRIATKFSLKVSDICHCCRHIFVVWNVLPKYILERLYFGIGIPMVRSFRSAKLLKLTILSS